MYTQQSLAESDYTGWVAWIDGSPIIDPRDGRLLGWDGCTPILESRPPNPYLIQLEGGGGEGPVRHDSRHVMDWRHLPHERVVTLEMYGFRATYPGQPVVSIVAQPDRRLRWIQYRRRSILVRAGVGGSPEGSPSRTGVTSWVMGYWDTTVGQAQMWDVPANGGKIGRLEFSGSNHPCWPRPLGFGLNPVVLGLTPEQVPEAPRNLWDPQLGALA